MAKIALTRPQVQEGKAAGSADHALTAVGYLLAFRLVNVFPVAHLVRALDCGSGGSGFEPRQGTHSE
jgi:hypothetical protein